ncbi:MAG: DUF1080 domain-containing protein, partial [Phycisphaerae bacterium]|nr:DUF1080 domain-containing protein [Phycisphaerae bacterium]
FFSTDKAVKDGRVKPAGQWNTLEITARGNVLTLWVNGAVTCETPVLRGSRSDFDGLLEGEAFAGG